MSITFVNVKSQDYERLYEFMRRDFPRHGELAPFFAIKSNLESGKHEGYFLIAADSLSDDAVEVGYMVITAPEGTGMVFGNYFAIHPELRSKGLGRTFLNSIISRYHDRCFVIEVSDPQKQQSPQARDEAQRRVRFYEDAGFSVAPTERCNIYGADMLVMTTNIYEGFSARAAMNTLYDNPSQSGNIDVVDMQNVEL